jgi:hypothetical protein
MVDLEHPRIPAVPIAAPLARAALLLQRSDAFDRELLQLFNEELPKFSFSTAEDETFQFSHVVMNGRSFQFNLAMDGRRHKIPVPHRHVTAGYDSPMVKLLYVNLERISIFDLETGNDVDSLVVNEVEGGYDIGTEEEYDWTLPPEVVAEQERRRDLVLSLPPCATLDELALALARETKRHNFYRLGNEFYDFTATNIAEIRVCCPSVPVRDGHVFLDQDGGDTGRVLLYYHCGRQQWTFGMEDGELRVSRV